MAMKEFICIICPESCHITVEHPDKEILAIDGSKCPRGDEFATKEVLNPERLVTSTVLVEGGEVPLVSVKTSGPIPKEKPV